VAAMKRVLKWAGIVVAPPAGPVVLAVGYVFVDSERMLDRSYAKKPSAVHANVAPDREARTLLWFQLAPTATART
jgi:hypothetical protein